MAGAGRGREFGKSGAVHPDSTFLSSFHAGYKHTYNENKGNGHQNWIDLMFKQLPPASTKKYMDISENWSVDIGT